MSREAVLAVATLAVFTLFAALWLAGLRTRFARRAGRGAGARDRRRDVDDLRPDADRAALALGAHAGAVSCSSRLAGGALLAGSRFPWLLAALGVVQVAAWIHGDRRFAGSGTALATATGLGSLGRLRLLEPPHSGPNYLLREMVFVVGRSHALKLRALGLLLAVLAPLALVALPLAGAVPVAGAAACHAIGALILRWLFFAEAEHVVGLYYGRR